MGWTVSSGRPCPSSLEPSKMARTSASCAGGERELASHGEKQRLTLLGQGARLGRVGQVGRLGRAGRLRRRPDPRARRGLPAASPRGRGARPTTSRAPTTTPRARARPARPCSSARASRRRAARTTRDPTPASEALRETRPGPTPPGLRYANFLPTPTSHRLRALVVFEGRSRRGEVSPEVTPEVPLHGPAVVLGGPAGARSRAGARASGLSLAGGAGG
jgi:hypothetical protein